VTVTYKSSFPIWSKFWFPWRSTGKPSYFHWYDLGRGVLKWRNHRIILW